MKTFLVRGGWVSSIALLVGSLSLVSCATTTNVVAGAPSPAAASVADGSSSEEDDFSHLIAQLRSDLSRWKAREAARPASPESASSTPATSAKARDREFAARAQALFAPLNGSALLMPVVGVRALDLSDSWGDARDGGKRRHRGIDIFAPKGTPVVAVADGIVSYIGNQSKGGLCLWLSTEAGASFYYAHLDRWATGLYEGMVVHSGDLLGYVGNTGNAISTPSHLHFQVTENDETVNPYPILTRAVPVKTARASSQLGGGYGTR